MDPGQTRALRAALATNAVFSIVTGTMMVFDGARIAAWLGDVPVPVLQGTGLGLFAFVALIATVIARPRAPWALLVSTLDASWVLGTGALLIVAPGLLTATGWVAAIGIALAVGSLAAWQVEGVRRMLRDPVPGRADYLHRVWVHTDVHADAMWSIVSDLGRIAHFAPGLAHASLRDGEAPGVGAVRTCANTQGHAWREVCERFDPEGRELQLRFQTDVPGFPFPAREMLGGWRVHADGEGSIVEIWWSLTPSTRLPWLLVALMGLRVDGDMARTVARMARAARESTQPVLCSTTSSPSPPLPTVSSKRVPRARTSSVSR